MYVWWFLFPNYVVIFQWTIKFFGTSLFFYFIILLSLLIQFVWPDFVFFFASLSSFIFQGLLWLNTTATDFYLRLETIIIDYTLWLHRFNVSRIVLILFSRLININWLIFQYCNSKLERKKETNKKIRSAFWTPFLFCITRIIPKNLRWIKANIPFLVFHMLSSEKLEYFKEKIGINERLFVRQWLVNKIFFLF